MSKLEDIILGACFLGIGTLIAYCSKESESIVGYVYSVLFYGVGTYQIYLGLKKIKDEKKYNSIIKKGKYIVENKQHQEISINELYNVLVYRESKKK